MSRGELSGRKCPFPHLTLLTVCPPVLLLLPYLFCSFFSPSLISSFVLSFPYPLCLWWVHWFVVVTYITLACIRGSVVYLQTITVSCLLWLKSNDGLQKLLFNPSLPLFTPAWLLFPYLDSQ